VVGHSLGGAIALELAAQLSTRVASLALLEPVLLMTPAGAAFARALAPLIEGYEAGDAEDAVHGFLALEGTATGTPPSNGLYRADCAGSGGGRDLLRD
jgi:pimeloyl-ACP methyl ester carboxylesterase